MASTAQLSLVAIAMFLIPALVYATCSYEDTRLLETEFGTAKYCEYKGINISTQSRLRDLEECLEVRCTKNYLIKCGFGKKTGVMVPPKGCKTVFHGCLVKIIQDEDSKVTCPVISPKRG